MQLRPVKPRKLAGDRTRRKLEKEDLTRMWIPRNFWDSKPENIKPEKSEHKKFIFSYLENIREMYEENIGLGLWGNNGSGKTSIMSMVLMEARRWGYTCLFVRAEQLRLADINRIEFVPNLRLTEHACRVDFLGIDDIGKEYRADSGYSSNFLHNLFRERSDNRLPTIFTTNFCVTDESFSNLYHGSFIEILRECCQPICISGYDYRQEKEERISKFFSR